MESFEVLGSKIIEGYSFFPRWIVKRVIERRTIERMKFRLDVNILL